MHNSFTFDMVVMIMFLLFTASIAAIAAKKVKFPFTILLVIIGLLIGWTSHVMPILHPVTIFRLTPDVILFVFLPALIFASAFTLDARKLLRNIVPIMTLAVPALLISTAAVGFIIHYTLSLPLGVSLLFGSLISATDPVAVIALFKEIGAPKRLNLLVEGESLFNDGTALVVFKIILGVVLLGNFTATTIAEGVASFVIVFSGGIATGALLGFIFAKIIEMVKNDPLVEITLTTILAHTAFIAAEHLFNVSGVMSTVAAGLTMGGYGRNKISPAVRVHMESFWEYFAFVCNSLIFLLVGLSIDIPLFMENYKAILIASFAVLLARAAAVYTIFPLIGRLKMAESVDRSFQTVIFWGGLRGALAIAIALSIPEELEHRSFVLVLTLGVVLFTLIVNGLTINPLMSLLGLNKFSAVEQFERLQAIIHARQKSWDDMLAFARTGAIEQRSVNSAEKRYRDSINNTMNQLEEFRQSKDDLGPEGEYTMVMRHALKLERIQYSKLFELGLLTENNLKEMIHIIDNELDRMKEGRAVMGKGEIPSIFNRLEDTFFNTIGRIDLFRKILTKYKAKKIAASYERKRARILAIPLIISELEEMEKEEAYSIGALKKTKNFYSNLKRMATERLELIRGEFPEYVDKVEAGILKRCSLNSELETYRELYAKGAITEKILLMQEEKIENGLRKMKMRAVEELLQPPSELMSKIPYFREFESEDIKQLTSRLKADSYMPGETIVQEGDEGDSLFIIGRGRVKVSTSERGREIILARLKAGEFFGEVALLHPQPRTATVSAETPTTLLELRREDLLPYMASAPHLKEYLEEAYRERVLATLLVHIPVFRDLSTEKMKDLSSIMHLRYKDKGDIIISEGERSDQFYIIRDGVCALTRGDEVISELKHGQFFGEEMTQGRSRYGSTVKAVTDVELYTIDKENFNKLIGGSRC